MNWRRGCIFTNLICAAHRGPGCEKRCPRTSVDYVSGLHTLKGRGNQTGAHIATSREHDNLTMQAVFSSANCLPWLVI